MKSLVSRFGAAVLAASLVGGGVVLAAAPAQAATGVASCSSLGYGWGDISGSCKAGNPSKLPYVNIGYSCWGSVVKHSVQVKVGTGLSFKVNVNGCGVVGITGAWLIW